MKKIKIKLNGYLKSINENKKQDIDVIALKKDNIIQYQFDNVIHKIKIDKDKVILIRENNEFKNTLEFIKNKKSISYYLLKEKNFIFDINIETKTLDYIDDKINIVYEVIDSQEQYEYVLEMRNDV